jgi:hypothetical protein
MRLHCPRFQARQAGSAPEAPPPPPSHPPSAFRALDGTDHEGIGRLLISFSNPVKAAEALHRAATGGTGAARTDSRHTQQPRHQQQREGSGAGGRASVQGSYGASGAGRSGGGMAAGGASRAGTILAPGGRMVT